MNVSIVYNNLHPITKKRYQNISKFLKCDFLENLELNNLLKLDIKKLIISDLSSLTNLIKIYYLIKKKNIDKKILITQELYLIEYNSFINEFFSFNKIFSLLFIKNLKHYIIYFINLYIFKILINKYSFILITSSKLRKDYLKKYYPNSKIYYFKNYPSMGNLKIKEDYLSFFNSNTKKIIKNKNYFFVGGRVNNLKDFEKICKYALHRNIKIIIASNQKKLLKSFLEVYKNIIYLGQIDNKIIIFLIKNCLAGLCLYNSNTHNQSMSCSIKFLELMALNKPAIISNNNGLINEINDENRNLIFKVNNIEKSTQFDYIQPKFNYNYILDEKKLSVLNDLN